MFTKDLKIGLWGEEVKNLQQVLASFAYGDLTGTGYFGTKTLQAVLKYQAQNGIEATGFVGPLTRASLNGKISRMNREKLYETAVSCLGIDVTPNDLVPDEVGCSDVVNHIHFMAFGEEIGGGASTYLLYGALKDSEEWTKVDSPLPGDIVISPSGYAGVGGKLSHGHVGIIGNNVMIMSNDSKTGKFLENYTIASWRAYYVDKGKYPMSFFRKV